MINDFISIIVPCYNEEAVINETNNRLKKVLLANFTNYEIIYVNDGSYDSTFNILETLSKEDSNIKSLISQETLAIKLRFQLELKTVMVMPQSLLTLTYKILRSYFLKL